MSRQEELIAIIKSVKLHIAKTLDDLIYSFHIDNLNQKQVVLDRLIRDLNKYLEEYKSLTK